MAKRIDRWALGAALAAGLYLFFLHAWDSVLLAGASAFACCALGRRFLRQHPLPRRVPGVQISGELTRLASLTEDQAQAELYALIRARYPGEDFQLVPVLKHPEAALSSGDILNVWKASRGADRLVVAATCPCEPRAALYARQLSAPRVAVVDSRDLARLLRTQKKPKAPPVPPPSPRQQLRLLAARIACGRFSPRNALLAAALLALYLRHGHPLYLFSGLALLFHLGAALLGRRTGKRLFEQTP